MLSGRGGVQRGSGREFQVKLFHAPQTEQRLPLRRTARGQMQVGQSPNECLERQHALPPRKCLACAGMNTPAEGAMHCRPVVAVGVELAVAIIYFVPIGRAETK